MLFNGNLVSFFVSEHVPKSVWDKIKPTTFEAIAQLANTITPAEISRAQYVILMEAVVRFQANMKSILLTITNGTFIS